MKRTTLITAIVLAAGLVTAGLTLQNSNPTQLTSSTGAFMAAEAADNSDQNQAGPLDQMAQKLKDRLEKEPGDLEGWVLLGRTYQYMNNQTSANQAYSKATALGLAPARLEEIRNGMLNKQKPQPNRAFPAPKKSRNLTAVMIDQALNDTNSKMPISISGEVKITPELAAQLANKNATLFIFARADKGPPMPLAAIRKTPVTLPFSFTLDDSNAVIPDRKLSSAKSVVIGARVSFSDSATASKGDLEGFSQVVDPKNGNPINIEINQTHQ